MKKQLIQEVQRQMLPFLNNAQLKQLQSVLEGVLSGVELSHSAGMVESAKVDTVVCFINAKRIEGCSEKTLSYYRQTIVSMLSGIDKEPQEIVTEDLRKYLTEYQTSRKSSKVTIDNIRRILSSYFSWLEDEDYIVKSPVRRIHKVKTAKVIKETYTDEALEIMRDNCSSIRDLAMIDLLASSGMRVGEMSALNRDDINFNERECVVFGKGSKERIVYFDARTKIHLQNYLENRSDSNPALFVSLASPHERLQIGGIERRLRELGRRLDLPRVHPHKFRRTLATAAIDKGMPIEQVQQLLGHQKIDTTMHYAMLGHVSAATTLDIYTHITDDMRLTAAANIDRGIGKVAPQEDASEPGWETAPAQAEKPRMTDFKPYVGRKRRSGTGCVSEINDHLFEGRYSPKWPDGKKHARNVYAHTREECEEKLKVLIVEMKAEIAEAQRLKDMGEGDGQPPEEKKCKRGKKK